MNTFARKRYPSDLTDLQWANIEHLFPQGDGTMGRPRTYALREIVTAILYLARGGPSSMVPGYTGPSSYLLMCKYNNYIGHGTGNGQNKIAVLDPNVSFTDPISGVTVMNEVLTILGPTPDPAGGVKEWCINSAAVDPASDSILAGSEDGKLYRWSLGSNTLTQLTVLTSGLGGAYTPTVIGADGTVYAINNAKLFAVGQTGKISGQIYKDVNGNGKQDTGD